MTDCCSAVNVVSAGRWQRHCLRELPHRAGRPQRPLSVITLHSKVGWFPSTCSLLLPFRAEQMMLMVGGTQEQTPLA